MLATPNPDDSGADLEAARAEVRATLKKVRQKRTTAKGDSKLIRLRTRLQRAYTEEELEGLSEKSDAAADTLPPGYSLGLDAAG